MTERATRHTDRLVALAVAALALCVALFLWLAPEDAEGPAETSGRTAAAPPGSEPETGLKPCVGAEGSPQTGTRTEPEPAEGEFLTPRSLEVSTIDGPPPALAASKDGRTRDKKKDALPTFPHLRHYYQRDAARMQELTRRLLSKRGTARADKVTLKAFGVRATALLWRLEEASLARTDAPGHRSYKQVRVEVLRDVRMELGAFAMTDAQEQEVLDLSYLLRTAPSDVEREVAREGRSVPIRERNGIEERK